VSACIITRDEEDRLGPCLDSLDWCDELLVVEVGKDPSGDAMYHVLYDGVVMDEEQHAVLGGNVGNSFGIRWRMWVFYFLVWLQKHFGIVPRRTLVPNKEELPTPTGVVS